MLKLEGTVEGDVKVNALFLDAASGVIYANTLYAPSDAALVAYDSGGPEKVDPSAIAGYAVIGINETLTRSSGATVPLRPDDDFLLKVSDPDTGYTYSERGYPAPTGPGWVDIPSSDAPGYGDKLPRLVGADPFVLFSFDAGIGRTPLTHLIEVSRTRADEPLACEIPAGSLPAERRVRLFNLSTGAVREGVTLPDHALSLSMEAGVGNSMLLVIEPLLSSGSQPLTLVFDRSVAGVVEGDRFAVERVGESGSVATVFDADGDTIHLAPESTWRAGARYELLLRPQLFIDLGAAVGRELRLPFKVAEAVAGEPLVDGVVADVAVEGDVMLVAARDQGLSAWDISDPSSPVRLGRTSSQISAAGVATDGFGHVVTLEGKVAQHVALRLWRLEELMVPGGVAALQAVQELSQPLTNVGPGDLELEVFSEHVGFSVNDARSGVANARGITASPASVEEEWEVLVIPAALLTPHHPVVLHDGLTGRVLRRVRAPASGDLTIAAAELELDPGESLGPAHPLLLRAHSSTLVWSHAAAGPAVLASITFGEDGLDFALGATAQNEDLLDWVRRDWQSKGACRELTSVDSVYLGRLAVARKGDDEPTLLAASRYEGLWGIRRQGSVLVPTWIECRRNSFGSDLADVAAAGLSFNVGGKSRDETVVAVVGHRTLEVGTLDSSGGIRWRAEFRLGWNATHVAIDPLDRLVVVRDASSRLAVYSLNIAAASDSWSLGLVADVQLPDGSGLGPLVLDPDLGLAVAGTAPVQYKPPAIELVGPDSDGDGLRERVEFLQPLGAPAPPPAAGGEQPPYLAWVTARILGVPDGTDAIAARLQSLAPGGGALPGRPEPFLPSSTTIELRRRPGLALDDPARHHFVSERPVLLIADERARSDYWSALDESDPLREALTAATEGTGRYALCRNCDPAVLDLPEGVEPVELASGSRLRVSLEIGDAAPEWLRRYEEAGLVPTAEVASLPWMPSPPVGRDPGIEARAAMLPEVELATGALTLGRTDLVLPAPGMDVFLGREYSSAGIRWGLFGWGWELAGLQRLRPNPDGTVDLYTSWGDRFVFGNSTGHPGANTSTLTSWGHPGELKKKADGSWYLLRRDGGYTEFSADGYPTAIRDRHRQSRATGSELRFHWHADGTLAQIEQMNGTFSQVEHPRTLTFSYEEDGVAGVVSSVEDSAQRVYHYEYDSFGRLKEARIEGIQVAHDGASGNVLEQYGRLPGNPVPATVAGLEGGSLLDEVRESKAESQLRTILDPSYDTSEMLHPVTRLSRGLVETGQLAYAIDAEGDSGATVSDDAGVTETVLWDEIGRPEEITRGGTQTTRIIYVTDSLDPLEKTITLP
ncbi:MAG TPA: DUF6531 domain-containing protein, partial [Candidatus Sulfomarinibacteraceae bacterium]|nr:DUF6531 domain-containing protein [Candidatus Sulfomarinibacteraceae bacterium]